MGFVCGAIQSGNRAAQEALGKHANVTRSRPGLGFAVDNGSQA
jgi:hypothetical protein